MRPRVFLDFSVDDVPLGRVIFELYTDSAPRTAENFRALCVGEKGVSTASGVPLYYKHSIMHRCIKDFMLQGGDFTKRNGSGGESIYGGMFADEDLTVPLDDEGLLCMANRGPDTNGSQFFVTLRACPHLNGKHVVFGKVIRGYDDVIRKIADVPVDAKDRPTTPVVISNCGELELRKKEPVKRGRSEERVAEPHHASSESPPRRKKSKKKKERKADTPDVALRPNGETEEEYDARLEREENERIDAQRRKELERIKSEATTLSQDGVRFKGRGRMKFVDPELSRRY